MVTKTESHSKKFTEEKGVVFIDKPEEELEAFLFDSKDVKAAVAERDSEEINLRKELEHVHDEDLFFVDRNNDVVEERVESQGTSGQSAEQAAWQDDDDEKVDLLSKNKYKKLRATKEEKKISVNAFEGRVKEHYEKLFNAQWAKRSAEDSDAPAALKSTNILFKGRRTAIDPDTIKIARARDANWVEYNQSIVTSLNWHQSGRVLMTAGLDKTVRLFNIDGNENEKLSSVFFKDLPILSSAFLPNSDEIILSGKRKHFYSYNTETGNILKVPSIAGREEREWPVLKASPDGKLICFRGLNGEMVLVSGKTKQLVHEIKMNGFVNDFAFSSDSSCLYSVGNDGEVYHWDLRNMSCFSRTTDIGARNPHCIAVSSNDMYMATGDESGIVNLYESFLSNSSLDSGLYIKPQLKRSIDNLTTSIQQISFNHDGQLLAMISRVKKDQCKIVHTATGRVYANWPTQSSPLGRLQCCQFSPNSGYLALGNDLGKVLLYRMLHYEKA